MAVIFIRTLILYFSLLLFLRLLGNIRYLDNLVEEIEEAISSSSAAWELGDRQLAVSEMETAMEAWHFAAEYAHIMLRQGEIDAVSDAFFDLSAALREGGENAPTRIFVFTIISTVSNGWTHCA